MIFLKILLWILLAVLGIIVLILFLPIRGAVSYIDNKLTYSAHYSFILLYNSDKKGLVSLILKWKKKRDAKKKAKDEAEMLLLIHNYMKPKMNCPLRLSA